MKLSIIVVTWNNENYIEQALKSCISDEITDYEVIVVHNASTDRTGEMIHRATKGYENLFRIIENKQNEGLGEGRNIGMRHAKGEYLMFLDGDDWYHQDALKKIYQIINAHKPELIIFDYVRFHLHGYLEKSPTTWLLQNRWCTTPKDRAQLMRNFGVTWNKVYKSSVAKEHGFDFPDLAYEDIVWNASWISLVENIYVIPDMLIYYRQRPGSILRSSGRKHFDTLIQNRGVLSLLKKHPHLLEHFGPAFRKYTRNQLFATLSIPGRLPDGSQKEYMREAIKILNEYDRLLGVKRFNIREKIVSLGNFKLYKFVMRSRQILLQKMKLLKKKIGGFKARIYRTRQRLYRWLYRNILTKLPLKENSIFVESYWGREFDCNPCALALSAAKNPSLTISVSVNKTENYRNTNNIKFIKRNSFSYYKTIATSKYLFLNVNIDNEIRKREGSIYVQTFHGTPIKKMGLDIRPINFNEMNWLKFSAQCSDWDYIISSNPYSSAVWRQSHPYNYKVLETGYPRNDILLKLNEDADILKSKLGLPLDKTTILYAPTFRADKNGKPIKPSEEFVDLVAMADALGENCLLLVRSHRKARLSVPNHPRIIDLSSHSAISEVLVASDILITDYSSIVFDYAILNRPIITYAYDFDDYQNIRGTYYDVRSKAPGIVVDTLQGLLNVLKRQQYLSDENNEKLVAFRQEFCPWDDGHATDKVLTAVLK